MTTVTLNCPISDVMKVRRLFSYGNKFFWHMCLITFIDKCCAGILCKFSGATQFKNISKIYKLFFFHSVNHKLFDVFSISLSTLSSFHAVLHSNNNIMSFPVCHANCLMIFVYWKKKRQYCYCLNIKNVWLLYIDCCDALINVFVTFLNLNLVSLQPVFGMSHNNVPKTTVKETNLNFDWCKKKKKKTF